MKTKEKTGMVKVPQVVFRSSAECHGYYRFHFGYLAPDDSFAEERELRFSEFLGGIDVPSSLVHDFEKRLGDFEFEVSLLGYLSQKRFDEFVREFIGFCATVQLYPGMLVLSFLEKEGENEG